MITLIIWIVFVTLFTYVGDLSHDAQAIILAICFASDLNLLSGLFRK